MKMQFTNNQEDLTIEKVGIGRKEVYRELEYLQPYVDKSKFVDMGLPSGRLWARCNIDLTQQDKFAQSEYSYDASFFSWGNIDGHNPTGDTFDYDFGTSNDGPYALTDGAKLTGDIPPVQDACRANLNTPWRMPTTEDFAELFDNIDFVQADGETVIDASVTDKCVTVNSITGIYLKSKVNGNLLFFPCSGYGSGTSLNGRGSSGFYLSLSLYSATNALIMNFGSNGVKPQNNIKRFYGLTIRPVI